MVIGLFASNSNAVAPRTGGYIIAVDTDVDLIGDCTDEASILCGSLVYEIDIAMGRVSPL